MMSSYSSNKCSNWKQGLVVPTCNPSTREAEAGKWNSWSAWATWWVQGIPFHSSLRCLEDSVGPCHTC
jgi:hypothetical protein